MSGFLIASLVGCASAPKRDSEDPKDAEEYVAEGDRLVRDGDLEKALVQFVLAVEADDSDASTFAKIGFIHDREGRPVLARRAYEQALGRDPKHVPTLVALGRIAMRGKRLDRARTLLDTAVANSPSHWPALNALGILADLEGRYVDARALYSRALGIAPDSAELLNNRGYSSYLERDWVGAEDWFRRAVQADEGFEQAWSNLALTYLQLGLEEQAKAAFSRVVAEHQADNNVGYFRLLNDDKVGARERFEAAKQSAPAYYAPAERNLEALRAGARDAANAGAIARASLDRADRPSTDARGETSSLASPAPAARSLSAAPLTSRTSVRARSNRVPRWVGIEGPTVGQIRAAQRSLDRLGYDPGPADGDLGERTRSAIRAFRIDRQLPASDEFDSALLERLL